MREILFRGKSLDKSGVWVEGSLIHRTDFYGDPCDDYFILYGGEFDCDYYDADRVDPETIGQFTGLTDKNGNKIFEGDIIQFHKFRDEPDWVGIIKYELCQYIAVGRMPLAYEKRIGEEAFFCPFEVALSSIDKERIKVIGNIYDNPELLEKK